MFCSYPMFALFWCMSHAMECNLWNATWCIIYDGCSIVMLWKCVIIVCQCIEFVNLCMFHMNWMHVLCMSYWIHGAILKLSHSLGLFWSVGWMLCNLDIGMLWIYGFGYEAWSFGYWSLNWTWIA